MPTIMNIPISKGVGLVLPFDIDELAGEDFPVEVYKEIVYHGLKQVFNRGMSGGQDKLGSAKGLDGEDLKEANAALLAKAEENVAAMRAGKLRLTSGAGKAKTKGVDRAIVTIAMRRARDLIKDALKRDGKKPSTVPAKDITAAAKAMLEGEDGPELLAEATELYNTMQAKESKFKIDVSGITVDPKLVEKAEKAKETKKKAGKGGKIGAILSAGRGAAPHHRSQ